MLTTKHKLWILICISLFVGYVSTSGSKTQLVRLIDIFVIGPIMIYLGYKFYLDSNCHNINNNYNNLGTIMAYNDIYPTVNKMLYLALIFFGSTTITYNLHNYLHIVK